jgi:hypothetical protein
MDRAGADRLFEDVRKQFSRVTKTAGSSLAVTRCCPIRKAWSWSDAMHVIELALSMVSLTFSTFTVTITETIDSFILHVVFLAIPMKTRTLFFVAYSESIDFWQRNISNFYMSRFVAVVEWGT